MARGERGGGERKACALRYNWLSQLEIFPVFVATSPTFLIQLKEVERRSLDGDSEAQPEGLYSRCNCGNGDGREARVRRGGRVSMAGEGLEEIKGKTELRTGSQSLIVLPDRSCEGPSLSE
ncbi:hypothetical protein IF2G_03593 [Cordyceps javanica]|nr:hypothetical protein IF2G_03593 [Cordyceps javanica]